MADFASREAGKLGGKARAKNLNEEQRKRIARDAAMARWEKAGTPKLPQATHEGVLRIANSEIPCAVLDDGTRLLTQAEFLEALGKHRKASVKNAEGEERIPAILQGERIKPFVDKDLIAKCQPIKFRTPRGIRASGYKAEILPLVCEVYLRARDRGALHPQQSHIAIQADMLVRGLANVGIIALVDEATGYQNDRARNALAKILEAFIAKELVPWIQTFPSEFYEQMFRLRGLEFPADTIKRPQYFGCLTNDIVYKRIAPGVLEELKRVTPKYDSGRRKHKYFQHLTENIGYPKLREHIGAVVATMRLSDSWQDFMAKLDRFYPRYGETPSLPFGDEFSEEDPDGRGL